MFIKLMNIQLKITLKYNRNIDITCEMNTYSYNISLQNHKQNERKNNILQMNNWLYLKTIVKIKYVVNIHIKAKQIGRGIRSLMGI